MDVFTNLLQLPIPTICNYDAHGSAIPVGSERPKAVASHFQPPWAPNDRGVHVRNSLAATRVGGLFLVWLASSACHAGSPRVLILVSRISVCEPLPFLCIVSDPASNSRGALLTVRALSYVQVVISHLRPHIRLPLSSREVLMASRRRHPADHHWRPVDGPFYRRFRPRALHSINKSRRRQSLA